MTDLTAPFSNQTTSKEAAEAIERDLNSLEEQVLRFYRQVGPKGATDEECEIAMDKSGSRTTRPRRVSLVQQGFLADSGLTRRTKSNRSAIVWVLKKFAADLTGTEFQKDPKETKASLFQKLSDMCVAALPVLELLADIEKLGPLTETNAVVHITVGIHSTTRTLDLKEVARLRDEINKPLGR
jgi:hypothetical protein